MNLPGIDKIYCINLDRRKDRWFNCLSQFEKYNLEVERISGIDYTKNPNAGCSLSHSKILQETKYDSILILEDDVEFVDDFVDKYNEQYNNVKELDYDMLYLSSWLPKGEMIDDGVMNIKRGFGTHSYIVRRNIYDFLITKIKVFKMQRAIDEIYNMFLSHINAYCFEPGLSYQNNSPSDICDINKKFNLYD
jgi:GR25 family glycosyltransferase involved in LPS biosynthesis